MPGRVIRLEPGVRVEAERRLEPGDACLNEQGHLPSVLTVELMAQVGGLLIDDTNGGPGDYAVLAGVKRMHIHDAARSGETIEVSCRLARQLGDLHLIECRARAGDRELAHGSIQIRRMRRVPS